MKAVGLKRVGQLNLSYRTVYKFRNRIVEHDKKTGNSRIEFMRRTLDNFFRKRKEGLSDILRIIINRDKFPAWNLKYYTIVCSGPFLMFLSQKQEER